MSRTFYRAGAAVFTVLAINACSDGSSPVTPVAPVAAPMTSVSPAAVTKYVGQGVALEVDVRSLGIHQQVSNTGALPSGGGQKKKAVVAFNIPNVIELEVLAASTTGRNNVATSQAKVDRTKIFLGTDVLLIEVLQANSRAECNGSSASLSGQTVVVGISLNGVGIVVTGLPNQVVPIPGGRMIINQQITSTSPNGKTGTITVRGVRVEVPQVLEATISQAKSGVTCS